MANATELTRDFARIDERVNNHIKFFWAVVAVGAVWLGWVTYQLFDIKGSLKPIVAGNAVTQLKIAAADPSDPASQTAALNAIASAKKIEVPIDTPAVIAAGKSFISASETDQNAWKIAQSLMEYRTYVTSLTFVFPPSGVRPDDTTFAVPRIPGKSVPEVHFVDSGVAIDEAARMERIGEPTNPKVSVGPTHLILLGGATGLDNMNIAHVIFNGVEVHYDGGSVRLQDVIFVNCTFVFTNVDRTRMLADTVISSKTVDFSS